VTSHIAAGHMQWFACFLLPYFIYLTLEITKDRFPFRRALLIALVLFAILLQGSIHIAVIAGMYLLLIVALNLSLTSVLRFVQITALAGSMALCKLLPAIFFFGDKTRDFVPGYYSVCELLNRLTTLNQPAKIEGYWQAGDWVPLVFPWECDAYIGFAGLAFLVACGICLRFRRWSATHEMRFKNMDWPMLLMVFFSLELNFYIVRTLQIPLISTVERVPSRFIIMPLLTLIAISAIRYQGLLNEHRGALLPRALGVLCALHVFHMLWLNGTRWCVSTLPRLEERQAGIVSGGDRPYEIVVLLSIIPTLIACIVWGYLYWRVTRRRTGQDTPTPSGNGQTERPAPPEPAGTS
jgi:hypothetical protein